MNQNTLRPSTSMRMRSNGEEWERRHSGRGSGRPPDRSSVAAAISLASDTDNLTTPDAVSEVSGQLGADLTSNVLKEFWPDLERRLSQKRKSPWD